MAGILGIYGFDSSWHMARFTYYSLMALQHRGQETCGITTSDGKGLYRRGVKGLVDQAFSDEKTIEALPGWMALGSATTDPEREGAMIQPVQASGPVELSLCLDGRVMNAEELTEEHGFKTKNGGRVLAELLSLEMKEKAPLEAVAEVMRRVRGAYSFLALTRGGEMVAARDPMGLRPLVIGSFGFDYGVVASESCALDVIGADFKGDINPGEAYLFTPHSIERRQILQPKVKHCAFEYVYLSRPDSTINGRSIYSVRMEIGKKLAEEHPVNGADIVLGVPETAIPFALAYSNTSKTPMGLGFVQTGRRVRSAIKPTQFERMVGVQLKLNPVKAAISGRRVVVVDDSVVRGTTTRNTVYVMRNRIGAKEIHVRVGSPKVVAPCPYGVEVPPKDELIAAHLKEGEVSRVVGADTFHWLSINGLVEAVGMGRGSLCLGCFTGRYPIEPQNGGRS